MIKIQKKTGYKDIKVQSEMDSINPTPEGVRILWVGGGGASEAPPKKSMMECVETPCCFRHIGKV